MNIAIVLVVVQSEFSAFSSLAVNFEASSDISARFYRFDIKSSPAGFTDILAGFFGHRGQ